MHRKMQVLQLFLVVCGPVLIAAATVPAVTSPAVPREFPDFDQNYTFLDNSSIRENLVSHADIDTEVDDLLVKDFLSEKNENPTEKSEQTNVQSDPDVGIKNVVEWIEDGDDTEDADVSNETTSSAPSIVVVSSSSTNTETISTTTQSSTSITTVNIIEAQNSTKIKFEADDDLEAYKDGVALINGSVAGILVGVFLVVCVLGYTALILWRRSLEARYGSREVLVTDDMFDPDDIKHFSI